MTSIKSSNFENLIKDQVISTLNGIININGKPNRFEDDNMMDSPREENIYLNPRRTKSANRTNSYEYQKHPSILSKDPYYMEPNFHGREEINNSARTDFSNLTDPSLRVPNMEDPNSQINYNLKVFNQRGSRGPQYPQSRFQVKEGYYPNNRQAPYSHRIDNPFKQQKDKKNLFPSSPYESEKLKPVVDKPPVQEINSGYNTEQAIEGNFQNSRFPQSRNHPEEMNYDPGYHPSYRYGYPQYNPPSYMPRNNYYEGSPRRRGQMIDNLVNYVDNNNTRSNANTRSKYNYPSSRQGNNYSKNIQQMINKYK